MGHQCTPVCTIAIIGIINRHVFMNEGENTQALGLGITKGSSVNIPSKDPFDGIIMLGQFVSLRAMAHAGR